MTRQRAAAVRASVLLSFSLFAIFLSAQTPPARQPGGRRLVPEALRARAARDGRVRVLVELALPGGRHVAEGQLRNAVAVLAQRRDIGGASARILAALQPSGRRVIHQYSHGAVRRTGSRTRSPRCAWRICGRDARVRRRARQAALAESVPLSKAIRHGPPATTARARPSPFSIPVSTPPSFSRPTKSSRKRVSPAHSESASRRAPTARRAARPGPRSRARSMSAFTGRTSLASPPATAPPRASVIFSGVAQGAHIMAVQVFTEVTDPRRAVARAVRGRLHSDIIAGLERVYRARRAEFVSVNMSLGGATFTAPCDDQPYKPAIDNLRSSARDVDRRRQQYSGIASRRRPACRRRSASDRRTRATTFRCSRTWRRSCRCSRRATSINSSVPGGGFRLLNGTSMATPHVTGTWAVLRQAVPGAGVSLILDTLRRTGLPITDSRPTGAGTTVPRVSVFDALQSLKPVSNPVPTLTSLSPNRLRAGGSTPVTLTLTGTNFNAFSVAYWNGAPKATTVLSTTQLQATIPITDLATVGTVPVWVATPPPGGGTSAALIVTLDPPPSLTVSAISVAPSTAVTTTLANGFGGANDWLALAATGSPLTSYISFTYVGSGVTNRTWTVTMPSAAGQYEFRLFLNNVYACRGKPCRHRRCRGQSCACHRLAVSGQRSSRCGGLHADGERDRICRVFDRALEWDVASDDLRGRDTAAGRDLCRRHRNGGIEQRLGCVACTWRRNIGERAVQRDTAPGAERQRHDSPTGWKPSPPR